ncbi:MAG: hypothetical protein ACTS5V_10250 [Giesbergeria sp.]
MYVVVIAWLYVTVMMAVAEATSTTGSVLGAIVTFVLYGLLPLSIVVYIMGTPGRRRKLHAQELQARAHAVQTSSQASTEPNASDHAPSATADPSLPPVREEP